MSAGTRPFIPTPAAVWHTLWYLYPFVAFLHGGFAIAMYQDVDPIAEANIYKSTTTWTHDRRKFCGISLSTSSPSTILHCSYRKGVNQLELSQIKFTFNYAVRVRKCSASLGTSLSTPVVSLFAVN